MMMMDFMMMMDLPLKRLLQMTWGKPFKEK